MKVLGISYKYLRKTEHLHSAGITYAKRAKRVFPKTDRYTAACTWMRRYFERIGDKMPHVQQIHLPHFLSKKAIYETMCQELGDQGHMQHISISRFYALWSQEFSFCTIPKVVSISEFLPLFEFSLSCV